MERLRFGGFYAGLSGKVRPRTKVLNAVKVISGENCTFSCKNMGQSITGNIYQLQQVQALVFNPVAKQTYPSFS